MINFDVPGLLRAVAEVTGQADATVSTLSTRAAKLGIPTSCDGCTTAGCCYQQVICFIAEALYIAKSHPVPKEERARFIEAGLRQEATDRDLFFHSAQPCVYLTPDKRCSVYERRPGACRRYLVVSKPELCMPGSHKKVSVLNTMEVDMAWVQAMVSIQVEFLGAPMKPIMMGALPRMVAVASEALEQPTSRQMRRFLRDQKWLDFDQAMAVVDPEVLSAYGVKG